MDHSGEADLSVSESAGHFGATINVTETGRGECEEKFLLLITWFMQVSEMIFTISVYKHAALKFMYTNCKPLKFKRSKRK